MKSKRFLIWLLAILLIGLAVFLTLTNPDSTRATPHTYPVFQPGIWDKPVIRFPPNSPAGITDYPFMFVYDLTASHGFDAQYADHVRPTFVLSKGKHAVIVMNVTSHSLEPCTVSFEEMIGFPEGYVEYTGPAPVLLEPGSSKEMALEVYLPENTTFPSGTGSPDPSGQEMPVGLFLQSGDWAVGQGFFLKVVP
jgi:hypothetical protein